MNQSTIEISIFDCEDVKIDLLIICFHKYFIIINKMNDYYFER